jgi:hypothetical protein
MLTMMNFSTPTTASSCGNEIAEKSSATGGTGGTAPIHDVVVLCILLPSRKKRAKAV